MRTITLVTSILLFASAGHAQSDKITAFALKLPVNRGDRGNTAGFRCESFQAGGSECPSLRIDLRFQYVPSTDRVIVLQRDGLSKDQEVVLMRVSLVDVERDEIVESTVIGLPQIGPQERSITIPVGDRRGTYQLWFQDYWEIVVNGMTRPQMGTFVSWEGSAATVYRAKAVTSDEPAKPQPKRKFKVD